MQSTGNTGHGLTGKSDMEVMAQSTQRAQSGFPRYPCSVPCFSNFTSSLFVL